MSAWIRTAIMVVMLGLPAAAVADDATTPATSSNGGDLQSSGSTGVSPATSSLLQPTVGSSNTPLQSAGAGGAGQSTSDQSSALQQPANSDQAKLFIAGDVDSASQPSTPLNLTWLLYILLVVLLATALTGILWVLQRRIDNAAQQTAK